MTTRNGLILFRIAKYQRVAVIDYPDVLTNTKSYTDIKLKLQCLVNEWAPANYATIQFIPTDYRDFDSRFEHITACVGRIFEFDEPVSFLIEYSERLYENEYSCKQGILITYSFEKDEKFQRIDTKFSSIPTNAEPDEITPDAVIFKDKLKTAYERRTGRQLCQASPDANYGIIQQSGIYDFNSKKVLEYNEDIKPGSYLCCGDYFYNIGENCLLSEKDIIEKTRNNYYDDGPDDYDYYRDTYYALGGDDYDALRRNGVDPGDAIDRLMDYQGY